jgi:hypothetical protein
MKRVTPTDKLEIRKRAANGETIDALAKELGYTYHQVDYAIRSERRKELRQKKVTSFKVRPR